MGINLCSHQYSSSDWGSPQHGVESQTKLLPVEKHTYPQTEVQDQVLVWSQVGVQNYISAHLKHCHWTVIQVVRHAHAQVLDGEQTPADLNTHTQIKHQRLLAQLSCSVHCRSSYVRYFFSWGVDRGTKSCIQPQHPQILSCLYQAGATWNTINP